MKTSDILTKDDPIVKNLTFKIETLERTVRDLCFRLEQHSKKEDPSNIYPEYISRERAAKDFDTSLTTVDKKIKKFGVSRLKSGGKKLLHRQEFKKALDQPDPFEKVINRRFPRVKKARKEKKVDPRVDPKNKTP